MTGNTMTALEKARAAVTAAPNAPSNIALILAAVEELAATKKTKGK